MAEVCDGGTWLSIDRKTASITARNLGFLRVAIGVAALALPSLPATPWVGRDESRRTSVRLFARTLGGRDLALGAGAILSSRETSALRRWTTLGALADLGDFVATLMAFRELPKRSRWLILLLTGGAAAVGIGIGRALQ